MTREEAIKELELIAKVTMWNDRREAVEMAIESLSADTVSRTDILGYIDRVTKSGLGKYKSLKYIRKYVERTESISAEPNGDLVNRQLLLGAIEKCGEEKIYPQALIQTINALPSADQPQGEDWDKYSEELWHLAYERGKNDRPKGEWITDSKPTKSGTYMVTLDAFGQHRYIELMCYGKPLMPNREIKGMCWYDSDDEWGDIVYDDTEILAWMPLPTPYGERREE